MNKIIDISGLPEEYNGLIKELVGLLRKRTEKRKMNQSDCGESHHPISNEIAMDGLSEIEVDFITSLVEDLRQRARQEPEHIRTYPMGVIGNISRADIYEEYLDHKFPKLPATRKSNK